MIKKLNVHGEINEYIALAKKYENPYKVPAHLEGRALPPLMAKGHGHMSKRDSAKMSVVSKSIVAKTSQDLMSQQQMAEMRSKLQS